MKNAKEYMELLQKHPLFDGVDRSVIEYMLGSDECVLCEADDGEVVVSQGDSRRRLGIVVLGKACVHRQSDSHLGEPKYMLVNTLTVGSLLGAANIFVDEPAAVTEIRAKKKCRIVFFPQTLFVAAMRMSFTLSENYMKYLATRIRFLAGRIGSLGGKTVTDKVMNYIVENAENGRLILPQSIGSLAETLSVGRASLYRAFDTLEYENRIARDGRYIKLL